VRDVALFDLYQGKGIAESEKSLAFRVVMQDTQRTLEDAEVEAAIAGVCWQSPPVTSMRPCGANAGGADMTLTKAELADLLFEKVGLNKREAKDMVEAFFDEVRTALERATASKLSGFGNFQLRDKPQRPGAIPRPAKRSRSRPAASSPSTPARS
jgi:nucleoid DNA-binding protein